MYSYFKRRLSRELWGWKSPFSKKNVVVTKSDRNETEKWPKRYYIRISWLDMTKRRSNLQKMTMKEKLCISQKCNPNRIKQSIRNHNLTQKKKLDQIFIKIFANCSSIWGDKKKAWFLRTSGLTSEFCNESCGGNWRCTPDIAEENPLSWKNRRMLESFIPLVERWKNFNLDVRFFSAGMKKVLLVGQSAELSVFVDFRILKSEQKIA